MLTPRFIRATLLSLLFYLPTMLIAADSESKQLSSLYALNNPEYHVFQSKTLGRSLHIHVRLPRSYGESKATYPTAYLLDGGYTFPLLGGYLGILTPTGNVPEVILVGIAYGGMTFEEGNLRGSDFTAPSPLPERSYYGGAPKFQQMLKTELIPFIEQKYRSNPARRIIFGNSLGGQFVVYTAMTAPHLFWGHLASNPAFHANLDFFLQLPPATTSADSHLFVVLGAEDVDRFRIPAEQWVAHWRKVEQRPWRFEVKTVQEEGHLSVVPIAFRYGLNYLLPLP